MQINKIMIITVLMVMVLAGANSTYAFSGGGNGGGCHGDTTCQAERQGKGGNKNNQKKDYDHEERDKKLNNLSNSPKQAMSESDKEHISHMREEEKIARDVYIVLYQKWGVRSFDNIQKSEQKHMDAVKTLIDKYELEDIMKSDEIGDFNNPEFQKLYNDLIEKGLKSKVDALQVAMTIEDVDIYDLEKFMTETENTDILQVFDNLNEGSKNHMRAFYRQLEKANGTYSAQYITEQRMQDILTGSDVRQDKGNGNDSKDNQLKKQNKGQNNNQNQGQGKNQGENQGQNFGFLQKIWDWLSFWD